MSNVKRIKKLILSNKETKRLYRRMQFLAIFMIVSCLVIIAIAKWGEYDQNKKREEIFGSWDEVFLNVDQEDLNYFRKNAFLEQISVQSIQEKIFLEGDQRVVIGACDENFLEMGNIELLKGRMPEHEKEVTVEEEYLDILGVSMIGDIVSDEAVVKSLRGYKVVGIIDNYSKRWKTVNPTIKYINCFEWWDDSFQGEVCVYVKGNVNVNNDIEINMIDYHKNIDKEKIQLFPMIGQLIAIGVVLGLMFIFSILGLLKGKINFNYGRRLSKSWIIKRFLKYAKKINLILFVLLNLMSVFLIINIMECLVNYKYIIEFVLETSEEIQYKINITSFNYNEYFLIDTVEISDTISGVYFPSLYLTLLVRSIWYLILFLTIFSYMIQLSNLLVKEVAYDKLNYYKMNFYYYNNVRNNYFSYKEILWIVVSMFVIINLFFSWKYAAVLDFSKVIKLATVSSFVYIVTLFFLMNYMNKRIVLNYLR